MKQFSFLIFLIGVFTASYVDANECQKAEALKTSKILEKVLSTQNEQIQKVLAGKKVKDFTPQTVFGHGFDVTQTEQKVTQIDKSINERSGIPIEYDSLLVCLEKLKINKKIEELRKLAKENAQLKISLLRKNQDLGDSLRKADIEENSLPELKEKIGEDTTEALQLKKELEVDLINSTTKSAKEKSAKKREILSFKNELTRLKIEYLEQKLKANKVLEEKIALFESYSLQLKALSAQIKSQDQKVLIKNFYEVEKVWLTLAKGNYYDLFWASRTLELAKIPELFVVDDEDESVTIKKQYNELILLRKEILKNFTDKKTQELKLLNQLVSNSNAIRSSYYETLGSGYFFKSLLKAETYAYFRNEVTTAPYRVFSFFYKKYLFIKEKISEGKKGYVQLFSHALIFILLFISFFSLRTVYASASKKIDNAFYYFFENFQNTFIVRKFYAIWVKVKDSTVPALWLITLELLRNLSYFSDVELVLRGIEVYLWANIIKSFVTMFLGGVSRLDTGNFQKFKIKAEETSNKFKNIFMFYFFNLLVIEATVGKVYSYSLVYFIVLIYTLYQLIVESSRWESEFTVYSEKMFAGVIVERFMKFLSVFPAKLRASFLLVFILVFLVFNLLISLTENFELSKKVSANLFKKQIEKIEANNGGADTFIPKEYKELFSPHSLSTTEEYVENGSKLEGKIHTEIKEWIQEESDEHSLAIYGDKGIGKTTLLKRVEHIIREDETVDAMYVKLPSKVIEKSALQEFINSIFNFEAESFDIYRIDKGLAKKTVVILDEAQNVFLSKTNGFDAYYALMNIINMNTTNLFWVMSFHKYSWLYLDRAFGRTRFVRSVFEVKGWSDTKIKELIMKRHQNSSYRLSYDLLINATRSQDEIDKYASIESKFFKLLWELSRGNPRSALFLWLSALSRRGQHVFNVNIPKEVEIDGVEKLPDDLLFVIACVLKHENLTASEIEGTTNLQKGLVRNAVKLGLEKNFFYRDARARYMVDISTQYGLIKYLRLKNFIYGA